MFAIAHYTQYILLLEKKNSFRSISRRKDYASVKDSIEVAARNAMQHTETQWLIMKYIAGKILQQ